MTPSPLLRFVCEGPMVAPAPPPTSGGGLRVAALTGIADWLAEIDRQAGLMRPRSQLYARFDRTARTLTRSHIRGSDDLAALLALSSRLRAARRPGGHGLHGLDRVWSRAELGVLITEAVNRARQLSIGRALPRLKGSRLDPVRLPDDRLDHLIQHRRDLQVVEALRAERRRRHSSAAGRKA